MEKPTSSSSSNLKIFFQLFANACYRDTGLWDGGGTPSSTKTAHTHTRSRGSNNVGGGFDATILLPFHHNFLHYVHRQNDHNMRADGKKGELKCWHLFLEFPHRFPRRIFFSTRFSSLPSGQQGGRSRGSLVQF